MQETGNFMREGIFTPSPLDEARTKRDSLFERYERAQKDGDTDNAALWFERFEVEAARVERMRKPRASAKVSQ